MLIIGESTNGSIATCTAFFPWGSCIRCLVCTRTGTRSGNGYVGCQVRAGDSILNADATWSLARDLLLRSVVLSLTLKNTHEKKLSHANVPFAWLLSFPGATGVRGVYPWRKVSRLSKSGYGTPCSIFSACLAAVDCGSVSMSNCNRRLAMSVLP